MFQTELGMTPIQLSQASSTRWLSYEEAVSVFLQAYSSILESLIVEENDRKCPKAHGFLRVIAEWRFVYLINMLHLVLPSLSTRLSGENIYREPE